jgi:2Fe-2S iron-sulfur cluster binding domain/Sarcosine oxidase A3 domain/Pyridine nucleotide-disulphide oxidoreductase
MVEPDGRTFSFEGQQRAVRPGASLLETVVADGLPNLQRSPHYHRPRAPMCGVGQCTGCLVRVNGRPNVRACRYEPAPGDVVVTENGWPSRRFDALAALDLVFRSGLDTLHGFRRPAWATPLYHSVVRRLAGFGAPPSPESGRALLAPPEVRSVETVILGAGRSGRACAARLVAGGERPLLIDRGRAGEPVPGADLLRRTTASFVPPPRTDARLPFEILACTDPARGVLVRARRVVVAVGSYDATLLFGSNDRPGVMTADGALAMSVDGRPPFRSAIVFGATERAAEIVRRFSDHVEALVAPGAVPPELVRTCSDAGIAIYPRSMLRATEGRSRVRAVEIVARGSGAPSRIEGDAVVLAHRRVPHVPVLFQVGARMRWHGDVGAYFPEVDSGGRTSVPGVWAVGSVAGAGGPRSPESGERAADALLGRPVPGPGVPDPPASGPGELEGYYRELLRLGRKGRWVACPCEDILLEEVEAVTAGGYRGIEVAKRYSGLGTGLCQGRYCLPDALLVLALREGRPPADVGYITQRPPVLPTPLAALSTLDGPLGGEGT